MVLLFMCIHIVANYFAVCSLNLPHLNTARLNHVLSTYLRFGTVPNPTIVNQNESVIIGFGQNISEICGFQLKLGKPLQKLPMTLTALELNTLVDFYKNSKYLVVPDVKSRIMYVVLEKGVNVEDVIAAYFHAVLLGIGICYYNQVNVNVYTKRQLRHITSIARLHTALKPFQRTVINKEELLGLEVLKAFMDVARKESIMFFTALRINGWDLNTHSIELGEWRANWKGTLHESSTAGHHKLE